MVLVIWLMLAAVLFFGGWLVIVPQSWPDSSYLFPACVSITANVIANVSFLVALRLSPLSRTIPFLALSPAFAALAAVPVVGEFLTLFQWLGIALVLGGVLLLNLSEERRGLVDWVWRSLREERGSLFMIGTALCWGIAAPFDKMAVMRSSIPVHAFIMPSAVTMILLAFLLVSGRGVEIMSVKSVKGLLLLAMVLAVFSFGVQLLAYREGLVGLAETIKRVIGMVSSLVVGALLLRERIGAFQVCAVGLMSLGVWLILWPA